jgi:maleate isomerase
MKRKYYDSFLLNKIWEKIMTDILGYRALFGVLGPSTNTTVQPEFDEMRPPGVTNHYSRIWTPDAHAVSNETFMNATMVIADNVMDAIDSVMTCSPDHLVMGNSAITFYDGITGADKFQSEVESRSKLGVSIGSHATAAALNAYGDIKKIAFISPYFPTANEQVRRYFEESGCQGTGDYCFRCPRWTEIAKKKKKKIRRALGELNKTGVDALVQVGTNLPMARLAAAIEEELEKPVIAINTATYWHALRVNNIDDKVDGFGSLLKEY